MATYADVELNIVRWAEARKIIPNSTPQAQLLKAFSEMGELSDAIQKGNMEDIKDAVGDTLVCMVNMCALLDINLVDCMELAYDQIKHRKGTMLPSGVFVKES
jgi:NTP pyrophosphatase (non-canonical NTP hydrolase)